MSIYGQARSIYLALKDDPDAMAAIAAERKTLALAIATDPNASARITSSTVNGQSFAMSGGITQQQRLSLLSLVMSMQSLGCAPSTTVLTDYP